MTSAAFSPSSSRGSLTWRLLRCGRRVHDRGRLRARPRLDDDRLDDANEHVVAGLELVENSELGPDIDHVRDPFGSLERERAREDVDAQAPPRAGRRTERRRQTAAFETCAPPQDVQCTHGARAEGKSRGSTAVHESILQSSYLSRALC
jgi:hypothetical protein